MQRLRHATVDLCTFWRLESSTDLFASCLAYRNEEIASVGLSYPYIDKSHRVALTQDFFTKKPLSLDPIKSLICGERSCLTLSGIVFFIDLSLS